VKKGDRVLLYMQNSPQFVLAFYGILRADAVVVPVNPMNLSTELRHYVRDSGAKLAIVAQDMFRRCGRCWRRGRSRGLEHTGRRLQRLPESRPTCKVPEFVKPRRARTWPSPASTLWSDACWRGLRPGPVTAGPDDLA
jgi:fatty-acyl-CoA synthase